MSPTDNKGLRRAAAIMAGAIGLSVVSLTACGSEPEVDPPATSETVAVAKNAALHANDGNNPGLKRLPTTTRPPVTLKMPVKSGQK